MKERNRRITRIRALTIESLDPRLCLTAGLGEIHVDNASAHVSHWHNPSRPHDVNQDRSVTPIDALLVVNTLNAGGARALSAAEGEANALVDVNGDSQITPADCLEVVNELNQDPVAGATVDEASSDDLPVTEVPVDDGTVDDGTVDDGTVDAVPAGHHGCDDSPPSPIADLLARADANEDGGLTKDELPSQLWDRLSSADTDGDGSINMDELTAFTPDRGPHGPPHAGHGDGDAFDRFDQNDDGALTEDELPEKVWEHLSPADTDGDGAISAEELVAYQPAPPSREDFFARLDEDGSGVLTKDELPSQLWDRLSSADTDGDGSITLDELIAFTPERGPHSPRHDGNGGGDAFDRFDQNDDGLLTEDELPERLWDRIAPADTDGDGALSAEELTTYRPAPPPREGTSPTGLTVVSSTVVPQEHGPAPHRGGGSRAMMPLGGSLRRV